MRLNQHLLDRAALAASELADELLELDAKATVYARACPDCGFVEASADPRILSGRRECPSCAVRGYRQC